MGYNYKLHPLNITSPELTNCIVWAILFLFFLVTMRKGKQEPFLSRNQTIDIRGFASLLVLTSHLWGHGNIVKPVLISTGETVAAFLFFSGFGLTISFAKKQPRLTSFIRNRIEKVFLSYWLITLLIIGIDLYSDAVAYTPVEIILTMFGINLTTKLHHMDFARWYITFILIWYILFFLTWLTKNVRLRIILLFVSAGLLFATYRHITFSQQFFAFPLGCLAGTFIPQLRALFEKHKNWFIITAILLLGLFFFQKLWLRWQLYPIIPYYSNAFQLINEVFNFGAILGISILYGCSTVTGWYSAGLRFCGMLSYPTFLLHGAFLLRHNFIFPLFENQGSVFAILLFIALILLSGSMLKKCEQVLILAADKLFALFRRIVINFRHNTH